MVEVAKFVTFELSKAKNRMVIRVDAKSLGLDPHKTAQAINQDGLFPATTRTYPRQHVDIDLHPRAAHEDQRQHIIEICRKLLKN